MSLSRWTRWAVASAVVVVPLAVAGTARANSAESIEVRRIRRHFDSVLVELRGSDGRGLSPEQASRRAVLIAELERYRARGVFPHNYDFPGQAIPYFVDRKTGTLCAVANLLAFSGRRDIVDRVAAANNNVWVPQLAGDTAFTNWLDANGLTLEEAAHIQVPYVQPITKPQEVRQAAYKTVAPIALIGAAATGMLNLTINQDGRRPGMSWTGLLIGATSLTAGALVFTKSAAVQDKYRTIGLASMSTGLLTMGVSGHALHRHSRLLAAQRDSAQHAVAAEASIGAVVTPEGKAGIGMSVRF